MEREVTAECQRCRGDGLYHGKNPPAPIETHTDALGGRHTITLNYCPMCMGSGVIRMRITTPETP